MLCLRRRIERSSRRCRNRPRNQSHPLQAPETRRGEQERLGLIGVGEAGKPEHQVVTRLPPVDGEIPGYGGYRRVEPGPADEVDLAHSMASVWIGKHREWVLENFLQPPPGSVDLLCRVLAGRVGKDRVGDAMRSEGDQLPPGQRVDGVPGHRPELFRRRLWHVDACPEPEVVYQLQQLGGGETGAAMTNLVDDRGESRRNARWCPIVQKRGEQGPRSGVGQHEPQLIPPEPCGAVEKATDEEDGHRTIEMLEGRAPDVREVEVPVVNREDDGAPGEREVITECLDDRLERKNRNALAAQSGERVRQLSGVMPDDA